MEMEAAARSTLGPREGNDYTWRKTANAQWRCQWKKKEAAAQRTPGIYVTVLLGEGLGNGQWRRTSSTCFQEDASPAPGLILTCQLGEGQWAMEPMERATDPGNI